MTISIPCDLCLRVIKITATAHHRINKDGLLILCKRCWETKGLVRDRYRGQVQAGYYLATN